MRYRAVLCAVAGIAVLFTERDCCSDPFTFYDDFEGYANTTQMRVVWDPDSSIFLGQQGSNQYLRYRVAAGSARRASTWINPTGSLMGDNLSAYVRCTAVNSGYAYFYLRSGSYDYRSIARYPLSTGMGWATFSLSDIVPDDFVRFSGKGTPDLSNVNRLGVTFWVNTQGLGYQYMEADNFSVTPEPCALLALGVPCGILTRSMLRRKTRLRPRVVGASLSSALFSQQFPSCPRELWARQGCQEFSPPLRAQCSDLSPAKSESGDWRALCSGWPRFVRVPFFDQSSFSSTSKAGMRGRASARVELAVEPPDATACRSAQNCATFAPGTDKFVPSSAWRTDGTRRQGIFRQLAALFCPSHYPDYPGKNHRSIRNLHQVKTFPQVFSPSWEHADFCPSSPLGWQRSCLPSTGRFAAALTPVDRAKRRAKELTNFDSVAVGTIQVKSLRRTVRGARFDLSFRQSPRDFTR